MEFVVNNHRWYVSYVSPNNPKLVRFNGTRTFGATDKNERTIYISNRITGELLTKVICHELCHVYCFEYGVEFYETMEEKVANFVAEYGGNIIENADEIIRIALRETV